MDASRIVVQPSNRGTGVAIIAALLQLSQSAPETIVGFFPSDHYFADDAAFGATVRAAIEVSRKQCDSILLIGAKPQWPEVEYGWIEPGASTISGNGTPLFNVSRFWEKPPLAAARQLMKAGGLWNTFVTIGCGSAFLQLLSHTAPSAVSRISQALKQVDLDSVYREIGVIDFSKDVLSRDQRQLLVIQDEV